MIIQELTELYGTPNKARNDNVYWIVRMSSGVEVSIQHSKLHYCNDASVEIGLVYAGRLVPPDTLTNDLYVLDLFGDDTVAGYVKLEDVERIIVALR